MQLPSLGPSTIASFLTLKEFLLKWPECHSLIQTISVVDLLGKKIGAMFLIKSLLHLCKIIGNSLVNTMNQNKFMKQRMLKLYVSFKIMNILIKVRVQFLLMKQYIYYFQFSMSHIFIANCE